jgi:hypothetical protein
MASSLNTKINSYALERGIEFDEAFSLTPTRTGTNPLGTFSKNTVSNIVYEPTVGPPGGSGSWKFTWLSTTGYNSYFRAPSSGATELLGNADDDYSTGFWLKVNELPVNTATNIIFTLGSTTGNGVTIYIYGANAASAGKLLFGFSGGNYLTPSPISFDTWYYIAIIKTPTAMVGYINGSEVFNIYSAGTTDATTWMLGNTSLLTGTTTEKTWNAANYYFAPSSVIGPTEIAEIWTAGSTGGATNVNVTETPATAILDNIEPTIAVTAGDHTEITTSIVVDAIFPSGISVYANKNVFLNVTVFEASLDMVNNVTVNTANDIVNVVNTFDASAEITVPVLSRSPMLGSADMGPATVYVTPNYYSMVKSLNPVFYFNFDKSTPENYGSWQIASYQKGSTMLTNQISGGDLGLIGAGLSWYGDGNYFVAPNYLRVYPQDTTAIHALSSTRSFTFELWVKGQNDNTILSFGPYPVVIKSSYSYYKPGDWNHVVVTRSPASANRFFYKYYLNGGLISSETIDAVDLSGYPETYWDYFSIGAAADNSGTDDYYDEVAIYDRALTVSEVLDHYSFINNKSPSATIYEIPATAYAQSGTHSFTVNSNAIPNITVATVSAELISPSLIAGNSALIDAICFVASSDIQQPEIEYGINYFADPLNSYAEQNEAYRINTVYSEYILTNINPYRYVTFDGQIASSDYGTDNDYAVVPTTIGGTLSTPSLGINGKSVKTNGLSYITDGVILNESEWDDNWGTGQATYHSSFWIKKAQDDTSTGLRVIWNLNGYFDNQHVILYQYQGKLHLNFNNGSGQSITSTTSANIDLFDGYRHFIAIGFDHTNNNNNLVKLYVDGVSVLVVNLGSYTGTTVNATSFVPANDEANNHPRLSVGCLITPFEYTTLPVVPTNTKIYVDDVLWAKSAIDDTLAATLFNTMPDANNFIYLATAQSINAETIDPSISTYVNFISDVMLANADISESEIIADRYIVLATDAFEASAEFIDAYRVENVLIVSDIMFASAFTQDGVVIITIPGNTMEATISLLNNYVSGITITTNTFDYPISAYNLASPWATWLRATTVNSIYPTREVA